MLRRSSLRLFIGSFFRSSSAGGTSGGTTTGANTSGYTGGGGAMPDFFSAMNNGQGIMTPLRNGDFGFIYDKALEWCSVSHAQTIAQRMNIDMRDIKFESQPGGQLQVTVDAPHATSQQVEELGRAVMQECPLARFRQSQVKDPQKQMQWLRLTDKYDR